MKKSNISEIIEDIKSGKMVIIVDDGSRENEGDLICAADLITPEIINFMASKGKGLICLPMSKDLCEKYDLKMIYTNSTKIYATIAARAIVVSKIKCIKMKINLKFCACLTTKSVIKIVAILTPVTFVVLKKPTVFASFLQK